MLKISNDWFIVQQGLKLSSWFSFDVIALFTFPSSMIQGWWSQCATKKWWLKKLQKFKRLDHAHIFVNVSLAHDYLLPMSVRLILPHHMR